MKSAADISYTIKKGDMTASQGPQDWSSQQTNLSGLVWQTPALSEKFQSRFGRRADSADPGLSSAHSDSTEDFCCASGSPSFQPIRSQICIPTAHVMPSTSGPAPGRPPPRPTDEPPPPALPKSASSPCLEAEGRGDCLSRYRCLVNGLDHSLLPPADGLGFHTPAVEPTLNQSGLLRSFCPEPRAPLQLGLSVTEPGPAYKPLPEADSFGHRLAPPPHAQAPPPHAPATPPPSWQGGSGMDPRWQQLEKLRLQVEQMQLLSAGSGQYSSLYPPTLPPEAGAWDAVVKASGGLLKEKELVIDRQKQQMAQLEQRLRESELQVHGALLGRGAPPYPDVCLLRLQEAQRENAFLRAQFAERSDALVQEKAESQRKLAAEEAESHRLSDALREAGLKHSEELKKQEERIRSRDKHISSLKKKCQKESEESRERQQRIETLERYLGDLPTLEHYQSQSKQLEQAQGQVSRLQAQVEELDSGLEEARAAALERDTELEQLRLRERDLLSTVTSLQQCVQESLDDGARLPGLDVQTLQGENSSLRDELHKHKKLIEKQQKMMDQMRTQIGVLHAQALQDEGGAQALREELCGKEAELLQMHRAVKELSAQNQELMEGKLTLQERLGVGGSDPGAPPSPAVAQLTQRLHGDLSACLGDLRSLCNVLTQRAQGHDPNLSLLLGITSPPTGAEPRDDWLQVETLDRKLSEVQQLRQDVEDLRTSISDRYAQDMGDNCTTQ
ncbi:centrosomal protein of 85 kDa isoform X2 [Conger conger]|uniref:centrosomal protein of 85 kDa isoform X2 n=1 Tax=Conger conger TaxID=82655 RepID=UPI002A5A8B75|nr:centrosomal protein of 85 kDa isoform X2 [Conger conger]